MQLRSESSYKTMSGGVYCLLLRSSYPFSSDPSQPPKHHMTLKITANYARTNFGSPDPNCGLSIRFDGEDSAPNSQTGDPSVLKESLQNVLSSFVGRDQCAVPSANIEFESEEDASDRRLRALMQP